MAAPSKQPSTRTEIIGFPSGTTLTGLVREGYDVSTFADIEDVRDEDNTTGVEVISNPGTILNISGHVQSTATIPSKGATITVNGVKYLVHDVKASYTRTICRFNIEARKPDSITYT